MNIAIAAGVGILLFLCLFLGYREGLRLGMRASKGIEPPPIKSPVQIVRDIKERHEIKKEIEAIKSFEDEVNSHDGYTEEERQQVRAVNK